MLVVLFSDLRPVDSTLICLRNVLQN